MSVSSDKSARGRPKRVRSSIVAVVPVLAVLVAVHNICAQDSTPKVYAMVIGVTDYGKQSGEASKAKQAAEKFAAVIRTTYGKDAVQRLLVDDSATLRNVDAGLREIKNLPAGSLAIIYFAGHGVREEYERSSQLYLRLHGSSETELAGTSVEASALWRSLIPTRYTNGMIFLDCCYAGSDEPDIIPEYELNNANVRAFMMCACAKEESATGDIFTNALLEVWQTASQKQDATVECMDLTEFERRVRDLVRQRDNGFMTPGIAFKTRLARCLLHMNEPSALLRFRFPAGCRASLDFFFNGRPIETGFQYAKDVFFVCQVAMTKPISIVIKGPGEEKIAAITIDPRRYLPQRIIDIPIAVPKKYATEVSATQVSRATEDFAELVEAYGAPPEEYYVAAAKAAVAADPLADTSWLLRKAHRYDRDNEWFAFASGRLPLGNLLEATTGIADVPTAGMQGVRRLESVGAYYPAAQLASALADSSDDSEDISAEDFRLRAAGDLRLAIATAGQLGLTSPHQELLDQLANSDLSDTQRFAAQAIRAASLDTLAEAWHSVPTTDDEWALLQLSGAEKQRENVASLLASAGVDRTTFEQALHGKVPGTSHRGIYLCAPSSDVISSDSQPTCVATFDDSLFATSRTFPWPEWKGPHARLGPSFKLRWTVNEEGEVSCTAESPHMADLMSVYKPGFVAVVDNDRVYVTSKEDAPYGFFYDESPIARKGPEGRTIVTKDRKTAIEYLTSKLGFYSSYDPATGINYIHADGEDISSRPLASLYQIPVEDEIGKWTNVFKDKESADDYEKTFDFPEMDRSSSVQDVVP